MASVESRLARAEAMIRQLQGSLRGNRVVWGVVNVTAGAAIIVAGTGDFSVVRNGTGDTTVTFDPPFSSRPAVTAIPISAGREIGESGLSPGDGVQIRFFTLSSAGASVNSAYQFVAIGPA